MKEFMIFLVAMSIAFGTNNIVKVLEKAQPTNISEYLKIQDDKIATQSAEIAKYKERLEDLENDRSDAYETGNYMVEYLTEAEKKQFWAFWETDICPKYHEAWYCEGDN